MDFFSRVLNIEIEYMAGWTKLGGDRESGGGDDDDDLFGLQRPPKEFEPKVFGGWFHQFHRLFLKEICGLSSYPPVLGDGKAIDLFRLFVVVREKGGYKKISKSGLWDCVAQESGLESCLSSSVKLIYFKYLDVLERWLEKIVGDRRKNAECKTSSGVNLSEYLRELGGELEEILRDNKKYLHAEDIHCELSGDVGVNMCRTDAVVIESGDEEESKRNEPEKSVCNNVKKTLVVELNREEFFCEDMKKKGGVKSSELGNGCDGNGVKSVKVVKSDGKKMVIDVDKVSDEVLGLCVRKKGKCRRKRKCDDPMCDDPMRKLLSWITRAAKEPGDPKITPPPKVSKWKYYGNGEPWKQVLTLREAMFHKLPVDPNAEQSNRQKMRPSMYEDHGCSYNLRERVASSKKSSHGDASTTSQNESVPVSRRKPSVFDLEPNGTVPIGPDFQAELPEWTGSPSEGDPKWLGDRDWPPKKSERRIVIERDPIGKGRQDACGCPVRNSVECVRFHVAEKMSKVKTELGSAFYSWQIDKMGEKVEMSWTREDRKKFETIIKKTPDGFYFWGEICSGFPKKSIEMLVSYYYNVHVLKHRAHQNRFAPDDIGMDDERSKTQELKDKASPASHSPNKKQKKSK